MLEQFESDLKKVNEALEQSIANHNFLIGQKQTLEHVIAKLKAQAIQSPIEKAFEIEKFQATEQTQGDENE